MAKMSEAALRIMRKRLRGHYIRYRYEAYVYRRGPGRKVGRYCPRCGSEFPLHGAITGPECQDALARSVLTA